MTDYGDYCNVVHRIGIQTHVCHDIKNHTGDHRCGASDCDITWPTTEPTKEEDKMKTLREKIYTELSWILPNIADREQATNRVLKAIEADEAEKNLVQYLANDLQLISGSTQEMALRQARSLLDDSKIKIEWVG